VPTLSENDPEPSGRSRPPIWLVAAIVLALLAVIALHVTGVVGPA
jgi:hypothetical protein